MAKKELRKTIQDLYNNLINKNDIKNRQIDVIVEHLEKAEKEIELNTKSIGILIDHYEDLVTKVDELERQRKEKVW